MQERPAARRSIANLSLVLALVCHGTVARAEIGVDNFTALLTITTDYVYRGLSQSHEDPAVQGGFQFQHDDGFFAGVWASSVDFPTNRNRSEPRDLEVDYYLGYAWELARDWGANIQLTRYTYPGDDPAFEYDYDEVALSAQFRDLAAASVHLSNDLFGRGERAVAYELSGRIPLTGRFEGLVGLGFFDLDKILGDSYTYWNVGVSVTLDQFALDLAYIDTSSSATSLFGNEVSGGRLVATVSAQMN